MRRQQSGFTLMEVLIALTVLAIALSTIVLAGTEITSNSRYLHDKTLASWVAQNAIVELRSGSRKINRLDQTTEGTETQMGSIYRWSAKYYPATTLQPARVEIAVRLARQPANHILHTTVGFLENGR